MLVKATRNDELLLINEHNSKFRAEYYVDNEVKATFTDKNFTKLLSTLKDQIKDLHQFETIDGKQEVKKKFKAFQRSVKGHYSSQERIIDMYQRLQVGEELQISAEQIYYGVHAETIKSAIYTLRNVLRHEIIISKDGKYILEQKEQFSMNDAFLLLMILYQSNSLTRDEVNAIQDRIIAQFSGVAQTTLKNFFGKFKYNYTPYVKVEQLVTIGLIFQAISEKKLIEFIYKKQDGAKSSLSKVRPLTLVLHNKLFYLVCEIEKDEQFQERNYRLDRILSLQLLKQKAKENPYNRFQPSQYINESYNMFSGEQERVRIKISNHIEEYLLRAFPTAVCQKRTPNSNWLEYEITVKGIDGIEFWLLTQKNDVEVLQPLKLRQRMEETIRSMAQLYQIEF